MALAGLRIVTDILKVHPIDDGGAADRNAETLGQRLTMAMNASPPTPKIEVVEDVKPPRRKRKSKATLDPEVAEVRGTVETEDGVEY